MKIKIFIFLGVLISIVACSKSDDDDNKINFNDIPVGSIVAEINGIETTFSTDSKATLDTIDWTFYRTALKLSISGKMDNSPNSENIEIWFFTVPVRKIDEGTYPDLDKQIYQYLVYNSLWKDDLYNYQANAHGIEEYSSKSTIYKIDSLVQGTFNGKVIIGGGPAGEEQPPLDFEIKNGKFNLKLE